MIADTAMHGYDLIFCLVIIDIVLVKSNEVMAFGTDHANHDSWFLSGLR